MVKATAGSLSALVAHPRDPAAAVDVRLRERRRNAAGALGQRDRQVRGARSRRQQGARQARRESVRVRQALPRRSSAAPTSATTPSRPTSARWSAAVRWATSASSRSATSWCCSASHQRLELQPWQPETQRTARVPFAWKKDTWYTMKLEVQNMGGGKVRARGKVWPKGETEPAAWTIERIDPIGSVKGARRAVCGRAVTGRRRVGAVLRQHQGVSRTRNRVGTRDPGSASDSNMQDTIRPMQKSRPAFGHQQAS